MAVIALSSAKGSPGVSTNALALALVWPRPVLLIECDPAGGDILAGYLAGSDPPGGGLLGLALLAGRQPLNLTDVWDRALPLDNSRTRHVLPAPADAGQWAPISDATDHLAEFLVTLTATGTGPDVLLDAGRSGQAGDTRWRGRADLQLVLLRPSLRGASAARSHLTGQTGAADAGRVGLIVVGDGPYRAGEIGNALGVSVFGVIAHDPVAAAVLGGERAAGRGFDRSPLLRSARSLCDGLLPRLTASATRTEPPVCAPTTNEAIRGAEAKAAPRA